MFRQFKNIDTAFRHIRLFSLAFLAANCIICCYNSYSTKQVLQNLQHRIFILYNGKLLEAFATDRREKLPVEIRDHVKAFHRCFYGIEPDDQAIKNNITKALYLADGSAKEEYDNLKESGYYAGFIAGNVSQKVEDPDSIVVDTKQQPYYFRYYSKLKIVRATTIATRSLVTQGFIRILDAVTDNNPHGFLIERWKILENKDLTIEKR